MKGNQSIFQEFFNLTKRDPSSFLQSTLVFFQTDYYTISDYFSGRTNIINSKVFEKLDLLKKELTSYFDTIHQHSNRMSGSRWWDLIEIFEDIDSRLQTLSNIDRWSRASITREAYSSGAQIIYTLGENQTLERVAKDVLSSKDYQDSWVQIALDNQLEEEDYSSQGGNLLNLQIDRVVNLGITVNSVVDTLSGKSIYGKDLDRRLTIVDEDWLVLGYDDTIMQSVVILTNLKKNDNPDNPELGLQTSVCVGGNRAVLNFPIITRQLSQTFNSDDTLKNFKVNTIVIDQDNLVVDYDVMTRLNEIVPTQELIL